jgi:hypothetical protein
MSEYQYYEFQAVDRPLTREQMAELRAITSRATITPTHLVNVYHWGNFKGDPRRLVEQCFDAFVYVANWGSHRFMLKLPRRLLDPGTARSYAAHGCLDVNATGDAVILEFSSQEEEGGGWIEDEEAAGWMPVLLPLRADLAGGDLRGLYLAWLAGARSGMLEDDETEPPVPPGLGSPSASLNALAEFLRVDEDLLTVAAAASAAPPQPPSPRDLERWIVALPTAEKDALLLRMVSGDDAHIRTELLRRFLAANATQSGPSGGGRTVGTLLAAAEERAAARRRREAERAAAERARQEHEAAVARATYLDRLAGREEDLWRQVGALVETKRPKDYDQAVQLLTDLRDLSVRRQEVGTFAARLGPLRERCAKRPSFLDRLNRAGLMA